MQPVRCVCFSARMCVAVLRPRCRITARLRLHCYSKQGVFSGSSLQSCAVRSDLSARPTRSPHSLARVCLQGTNCELNTLGSDDFPDGVRKQPSLQLGCLDWSHFNAASVLFLYRNVCVCVCESAIFKVRVRSESVCRRSDLFPASPQKARVG